MLNSVTLNGVIFHPQLDYKKLMSSEKAVIFDIKGVLPKEIVDGRL